MASPDFVKGGCGHCGGHIEFPAAGAGQTVSCPHCGCPTVLVAADSTRRPGRSSRAWLITGAAVAVLAAGVVAAVFLSRKTEPRLVRAANPALASSSNGPMALPSAPVAASVAPPPERVTNGFSIMPYQLERTAGSSLVYVVGTVRNTSDHQRFGIKIQFGLFDTNDQPIGLATDYQSLMEPHAEWRFKAMVMASKTASARFWSIAEDQ